MPIHAGRTRNLRFFMLIAALYMTQGIPLGLAMEALPTLLRQDGASLAAVAWLPLVALPWVLKFLWAPLVDNHWSPRLGRRRSWILPMQTIVLLCLLTVAAIGMTDETTPYAIALLGLAALASATQDTATDGLAVETLSGPQLAHANAVQVGGTMIGFFIGGAGNLILSGLFGRSIGMLAVAIIVAAGLLFAWLWQEPVETKRTVRAKPASLITFVRRPGAWVVMILALATALAAASPFALFKLFLVDQGWSLETIGTLGMGGGIATIFIGCGLGALIVSRLGVRPVMVGGLLCLLLSALIWLGITSDTLGLSLPLAFAAVILGSVGSGSVSVSLMTFAMRFAQQGEQAGTDMTSVQCSRDMGEMASATLVTLMAASLGYASAFAVTVAIAAGTIFLTTKKTA